MKKFLKWTGIVFGALIGLALLSGLILYQVGIRKLTRTYPGIAVETVSVPSDADAVARGRHVAITWSCTRCHSADLRGALITNDPIGGTVRLLGAIPASNLTSGNGGIASTYTDADWVRAIRHGVKPNGQVEIFMYRHFWTMSDQDLGDLLAYIKQTPPADAEYAVMRYGPIVPVAAAVGLLPPAAELIDHRAPRPAAPAPGATTEYGRYLSGLCTACHGQSIAGRFEKWKRDDFVRAFHTGVLPNGRRFGPTMSSRTIRELNDMELTALWLYFRGR